MPSIYRGCTIENDFDVALSEFRKSLAEIQKDAMEQMESLRPALENLSNSKTKATALIGSSSDDNEIRWTAVEEGQDGNAIFIYYDYLGPIYTGTGFADRPPSSYVDPDNPTHVHCILAVNSSAEIDPAYPTSACFAIWISEPDVQALVEASLPGTGSGLPTVTAGVQLSGGKGSPLTDASAEANNIARVFGASSHQDLMRSFSIPVVENVEDAKALINSQSSDYVVIGDKLLIVEGTNLVAIRTLYEAVGKDLSDLKDHLTLLQSSPGSFIFVMTRNIEIPSTEIICGEEQTFVEVREDYFETNKNIETLATSTNTSLGSINTYVLWSGSIVPSSQTRELMTLYGLPDDYAEVIFTEQGSDTDTVTSFVQMPVVDVVEDPALLTKLGLSDSELEELLSNEEVEGLKTRASTSVEETAEATTNLFDGTQAILQNGLRNRTKNPIVASQAVNMSDSFQDSDRSKELADRGKACARQSSFLPDLDVDIPNIDFPDVDFPDLPNPAKRIESMFGSISSAVQSSIDTFNGLFDAATGLLSPYLNQIQNLNTLAENLNEGFAECGLGSSQSLSGTPQLGGGGVNPTSGGLSGGITPSIGGIPVPAEEFQKFMGELSGQVNETVTDAVSSLMQTINKPVCMAQQLLSTMKGPTTESETNPCKETPDPDDTCPPAAVQEVANASTEISQSLNSLPQLENETLSNTSQETIEEVEAFTGRTKQTILTYEEEITRGIKKVVDELYQSFESKLELLDKFDQAIQAMATDTQEVAFNGNASQQNREGCNPPSVGFFSDSITELL
jgi:hypothetical protein